MKTTGLEFEETKLDMVEEYLLNHACHFCGHTGQDVNHSSHEHIGGRGEVIFPCCDSAGDCIARVEGSRSNS